MGVHSLPPLRCREVMNAGRMVFWIATGLVALGLVMVYSTCAARDAAAGRMISRALVRQCCWALVAGVLGYCVANARLETLRRLARPLLIVSVVLLAITLLIAPPVNGSRRWLRLGILSFQPSEMLKIAVLLYLADRLADRERQHAFRDGGPLLPLLAPVGVGVLLVFMAPDLGTSLFLMAEVLVLLGFAGVRPRQLIPMAITVLPVVLFYAYTKFGHVRRRIAMYTGGLEANAQAREAVIAIGSGGLVGHGLGRGTQKLHFFSESHTDFIFAVIGEELGFLGSVCVLAAFMAIAVYGRRIAWRARAWRPQDPFAFYVAAGAAFIVVFQALVNIAVVTATAPTKGVSLPFISVGGSNLLMATTCVALLYNVAQSTAESAVDDPFERM